MEKRSVACAAQIPLWGRINFPQLLGVLLEWLLAEELCFTQALPSFQEQPLSHGPCVRTMNILLQLEALNRCPSSCGGS